MSTRTPSSSIFGKMQLMNPFFSSIECLAPVTSINFGKDKPKQTSLLSYDDALRAVLCRVFGNHLVLVGCPSPRPSPPSAASPRTASSRTTASPTSRGPRACWRRPRSSASSCRTCPSTRSRTSWSSHRPRCPRRTPSRFSSSIRYHNLATACFRFIFFCDHLWSAFWSVVCSVTLCSKRTEPCSYICFGGFFKVSPVHCKIYPSIIICHLHSQESTLEKIHL